MEQECAAIPNTCAGVLESLMVASPSKRLAKTLMHWLR
jgi:hypothetical protein